MYMYTYIHIRFLCDKKNRFVTVGISLKKKKHHKKTPTPPLTTTQKPPPDDLELLILPTALLKYWNCRLRNRHAPSSLLQSVRHSGKGPRAS